MERLSQWITTIANLSVLAGIVFLAYEIRINADAILAESAASSLANSVAITTDIALNPETMALRMKMDLEDWESVPFSDAFAALNLVGAQFKAAELTHYQWRTGNLDPGLWSGTDRGLYMLLYNSDMSRESWIGMKQTFGPDFQDYIDRMVEDVCARKECRELPELMRNVDERPVTIGAAAWSSRNGKLP